MSEANPVDRKQFPLGRLLFAGGLLALVLVVALMFYRLYDGSRATFGSITAPTPTAIELPGRGAYILTRAEGISDDRALTAMIETSASRRSIAFVPNDNTGFFTVNSETNQILGGFNAPAGGPVTITAAASAYPLVVRRDPLAWAISCLKLAAIFGTFAAASTAIGAFIAIQRFNEKQRRSRQAFQSLME